MPSSLRDLMDKVCCERLAMGEDCGIEEMATLLKAVVAEREMHVHPFVRPCVRPSICIRVCIFVCLLVCQYLFSLSIGPSVCLSVRLLVYLS